MPRHQQPAGACPKCQTDAVVCTYNAFDKDGLHVDSWEHKCPNCGHRETRGFRSDDVDLAPDVDPRVCPYCGRTAPPA